MIAELDKKRKITDKFVKGFGDNRHQSYLDYSIHQLLAQRVDSIILGYEDINDHDDLRYDYALTIALQKLDNTGDIENVLAGKSTLNRLEYILLRLWLSSMAYVLMESFRQNCLNKTSFSQATVGTIRLIFLKLGARIIVSCRRILIAISSSCPYQDILCIPYSRIQAFPDTE